MDGAIRLVQQQSGKVAGLVAIAMEDNEKTQLPKEISLYNRGVARHRAPETM